MSGDFVEPNAKVEKLEHSLEMHLPFIYQLIERSGNTSCKIVPIIVGELTKEKARIYGENFAKYISESSLFVISSDFCHWGERFSYYYLGEGVNPKKCGEIWKHVKALDFKAIELIEKIDIEGFVDYLEKTQITICGRNAILLLLATVAVTKKGNPKFKFIAYDQSQRAESESSSSVSYASAYVTM